MAAPLNIDRTREVPENECARNASQILWNPPAVFSEEDIPKLHGWIRAVIGVSLDAEESCADPTDLDILSRSLHSTGNRIYNQNDRFISSQLGQVLVTAGYFVASKFTPRVLKKARGLINPPSDYDDGHILKLLAEKITERLGVQNISRETVGAPSSL